MAEILLKATDYTHPDATKDRRGSYKRGMPVVVVEDGHEWGSREGLPKFAVLKFPGVSVDRVQKYIELQFDAQGEVYRRRRWRVRWEDLPQAARNKLASTGQLVIKAGTYDGTYDYTWEQVRSYFRDQLTGTDESGNI
jgi:hypothetical protein